MNDQPNARQKVRFSNREFERSHMRAPRGRGSWAFCFDDNDEPWFAGGNQPFADAKREAAAEARRRGASEVRVQP